MAKREDNKNWSNIARDYKRWARTNRRKHNPKTDPRKPAISTMAINIGLMCGYDGQIFNEDTLINDVRMMLDEYNYETNVKVAIERIQELSDKLEKKAYKMTLLKENEDG
ncbi:MAG: hypothetical protein HOI55_06540 [Candidatus Marinimicrobia bacterium]|nr:hypothetical protein [Candidatus Neomarinimicrobiota bacterium]